MNNTSSLLPPICIQLDGQLAAEHVFVDNGTPSISWKNPDDFKQASYQIIVCDEAGALLWDSGKVDGTDCRWLPWGAPPLLVRQSAKLQIRVFDVQGNATPFSAPVICERPLATNADWGQAKWIWFDKLSYDSTPPSPYFRKVLQVRRSLRKARLYITARGVFQASINGNKVSQDLLQPGWVDFKQHVPFLSYDVTHLLKEGNNAIGAILADGWCCGNLTERRRRNVYHQHPELLARLELFFADGTMDCIVTDESWRVSTGPITFADLYDGEHYDARLEMPGWDTPEFDDCLWSFAAVSNSAQQSPPLLPKTSPAVRHAEELKPVALLHPRKGMAIWDFGQNFTGVFRARFKGKRGHLMRFHVAEMLDENQYLYTDNYRSALSEDFYICKSDDMEEYTPCFTFHGFRYLQIFGFQLNGITAEDVEVTGLPMYSQMPLLSQFSTGLPLINRLWLNALWGQKSNFLELPTDCPQRDERMGWTGDAQIFAPTAMMNMDCLAFFRKYLRDIREAQAKDGASPSIAPAILHICDGAAGWGDAIVTIPWHLFCHYGCKKILEENYEAMKRSNAYQLSQAKNFIVYGAQFGDWLALEDTPAPLIATAYFAYTTQLIAKCAKVLGKTEDEAIYQAQTENIQNAFRNAFVDKLTGLVTPATQFSLSLALEYQLLRPEQCEVNRLALDNAVRAAEYHIQTGFLGTPLLPQALINAGYEKTACNLLLQEEYPSWLYSVLQGATTIWERWNSFSHKNGFGDVIMNSFNHYAYGCIAHFMMQEIAGIHYQHKSLTLKIIPDRRFSPVKAAFNSPYGIITSEWHIDNDILTWAVSAPYAILTTIIFPDGTQERLYNTSSTYRINLPFS